MWWINKFGSISGPYSDEQILRGIQQRRFARLHKISSDRQGWKCLGLTHFWDPSMPDEEASNPIDARESGPFGAEYPDGSASLMECGRAGAVKRTDRTKRIGIGLCFCIVIAVAALICIICIVPNGNASRDRSVSRWKTRTINDYRNELIQSFNEELLKPSSVFRKFIEDAHLTVTVKSTRIVRCDVMTVDGSKMAGENNSNIDNWSMLIRFNWEGIVDTGCSDLRIVYDVQNDRPIKSEIEYTTALFNTKDPSFWWNVGYLIGAALSSGND